VRLDLAAAGDAVAPTVGEADPLEVAAGGGDDRQAVRIDGRSVLTANAAFLAGLDDEAREGMRTSLFVKPADGTPRFTDLLLGVTKRS